MGPQVITALAALWLAVVFVTLAVQARKVANAETDKQILRRCRAGLQQIMRDIERVQANRAAHALMDQCRRTEQTIQEVETEISR